MTTSFRLLPMLLMLAVAAGATERTITFGPAALPDAGAVVVPVTAEGLIGSTGEALDRRLGGALEATLAAQAAKPGETRTLLAPGPYERVVLVALPETEPRRVMLEALGGLAAKAVATSPAEVAVLLWDPADATPGEAAHLAVGASLGQYRFDRYRTVDEPVLPQGARLEIGSPDPDAARAIYDDRWAPVVRAVRFTRDLVSEPANVIYPESFVERAREAFKGLPDIRIAVLDEGAISLRGMGALAGVGQGSARPPRLLAVQYSGGAKDDPPLAFVGKGITFDTGGISLKDGNEVWRMKTDMAGAAAAIGAVLALAGRGAEVNAVGVAALAENMPSGTAQRPGDVVKTGSGKTIEILNTDAEGRLVLADGVWFAQQEFKPAVMVDLATLTGSVVVALGDEYAGVFSRDDALANSLLEAGREAGEGLWHLPLHPSYAKDIESKIADIRNITGERRAGASIGATVIGTFVDEDQPWAHLDIAGVAWEDDEDVPTVPAGASGFGVRLLDNWAERYSTSAD